jgi:hypothetical protein
LWFWYLLIFPVCAQAGKVVIAISKLGAPIGQTFYPMNNLIMKMMVGRVELHPNMGSEQWTGSC